MELKVISGEYNTRTSATASSINLRLNTIQYSPKSISDYIKRGSTISAITILLASSLGPRFVLVPQSIYDLGIYFGIVLLLLAMAVNVFSSYCLIIVSEKTGLITYKGLGDNLYSSGRGTLFEILMVISCFFRVVVHLIHLGNILALNFGGIMAKAWIWYLLVATVLFPMSLVRYISNLRYLVIVSIVGAVLYVGTITSETIYITSSQNIYDLSLFTKNPFDLGFQNILSYTIEFLTCFNCQSNILSVYEELDYKNSRKGFNSVLASYCISSSFYIILGTIGSFIFFAQGSDFYDILAEANSLYPLV